MKHKLEAVVLLFCFFLMSWVMADEVAQDLKKACASFLEEETQTTKGYGGYSVQVKTYKDRRDKPSEIYFSLLAKHGNDEGFLKGFSDCQQKAFRDTAKKYPHKKLRGVKKPDLSYLKGFPRAVDIEIKHRDPFEADVRKAGLMIDLYTLIEHYSAPRVNRNLLWPEEANLIREYRVEVSRLDVKNVVDRETRARFSKGKIKYQKQNYLALAKQYSPTLYAKVKNMPKSDPRYERLHDTDTLINGIVKSLSGFDFWGTFWTIFRYLLGLAFIAWVVNSVLGCIARKPKSFTQQNQKLMTTFGKAEEERHQNIIDFFEQEMATIRMQVDYKGREARIRKWFERNVRDLEPEVKEMLITAYLLYNAGFMIEKNFYLARFALLFGGGHKQAQSISTKGKNRRERDITHLPERGRGQASLPWLLNEMEVTAQSVGSLILRELEFALKTDPDHSTLRYLYQRLSGENPWADEDDLKPGESITPDYEAIELKQSRVFK